MHQKRKGGNNAAPTTATSASASQPQTTPNQTPTNQTAQAPSTEPQASPSDVVFMLGNKEMKIGDRLRVSTPTATVYDAQGGNPVLPGIKKDAS